MTDPTPPAGEALLPTIVTRLRFAWEMRQNNLCTVSGDLLADAVEAFEALARRPAPAEAERLCMHGTHRASGTWLDRPFSRSCPECMHIRLSFDLGIEVPLPPAPRAGEGEEK